MCGEPRHSLEDFDIRGIGTTLLGGGSCMRAAQARAIGFDRSSSAERRHNLDD